MNQIDNNDNETAAFMVATQSITAKLAAIHEHTADHFCVQPDDVTWSNVADAFAVNQKLDEIFEFLGLPIPVGGGF